LHTGQGFEQASDTLLGISSVSNMVVHRSFCLLLCLSLGLAASSSANDARVVVGQTFLANSLNPTEDSVPWALTSHGVAEKLFTVDENGELVGQIAQSVEKVDEITWEVTLKPDYFFSDGTPVSAGEVAASLLEQNEKNSFGNASLGAMTITASTGLTLQIQSERPTHIMDSVLAEFAFVIYKKDVQGNFIFTGPYIIDHYAEEDHMDLSPNTFYPQASERPKIEIKKFADGHELATAVESQQVDIGFHLPIDRLPALRDVEGTRVKSFEVGYHYMVFYNIDRLPDVRVRKAMDLVIDRQALAQALAGGIATRSLFPDNSPFFSDSSDPHGDLKAATLLMEEAGWTLNDNNKLTKEGQELSVILVAYPHRPGLGIMQPIIQKALEDLGITVTTIMTGQDWSETQQIIDDRSFDMLMWAQHTLPAGDPLFFLNNFFRSDGGSNHANLVSAEVDTHLDALAVAEDHNSRILMAQVAQAAIHNEVPVSNLVTPMWHVSVSDRLANYKPWGSDYYIIRADLRVTEVNDGEASSAVDNGCFMLAALALVVPFLVHF
jgi:peptide/nickel transport system substrate-binding protein